GLGVVLGLVRVLCSAGLGVVLGLVRALRPTGLGAALCSGEGSAWSARALHSACFGHSTRPVREQRAVGEGCAWSAGTLRRGCFGPSAWPVREPRSAGQSCAWTAGALRSEGRAQHPDRVGRCARGGRALRGVGGAPLAALE